MKTLWDTFVEEFGEIVVNNEFSVVLELFWKFIGYEGPAETKILSTYRYIHSGSCRLGNPSSVKGKFFITRGGDL